MPLKRAVVLVAVVAACAAAAGAQTVTNYSYKLDNGIKVVTERGWNWCRATQSFANQERPGPTGSLTVAVSAVGDLIAGSEVKVLKAGAEVDPATLAPGSYDLRVACPLSSATKGTISFDVAGVAVKPGMDTRVAVSLHDVQVAVDEKPEQRKGLAYYETKTNRYQGNWEQNGNWSLPRFYAPGDHKAKIAPDEPGGDYYGKIKPGTYDICLDIFTRAGGHLIWLENLSLKPDAGHRIVTNLNAAEVAYTGGKFEVKMLHFYPAGTAAKTKGKPRTDKRTERFAIEGPDHVTPCPPGTYDVLVDFSYGLRYEWRTGVTLEVGRKAEIK
ncbi:hypothetical protein EG831_07800 [bacterium]|nr:hypothetical protein [bacterium]